MTTYNALPLPNSDATWRVAIGVALTSAGGVLLFMNTEAHEACGRAWRHPKIRQFLGNAVETAAQSISEFLQDPDAPAVSRRP